jgi:uncharacterized protein YktB (UPF0637 family)
MLDFSRKTCIPTDAKLSLCKIKPEATLSMTEHKKLIDNVQRKTEEILTRYSKVKQENLRLKQVIEENQLLISDQKQIIKQLEDKITILKITKSLERGKENSDARLKINEMLSEIDKCIGLIKS